MEEAALLRGKSYAITAHFMPNHRKSRHKVRRFLVFSVSMFIFLVSRISIFCFRSSDFHFDTLQRKIGCGLAMCNVFSNFHPRLSFLKNLYAKFTDLCRKLAEAGVNFAERCCMANSKSVINFINENNIHDAQQLTSLLCGDASSGKLTPYPKGFCYAMWKERLKVLRVFYGLEVEPETACDRKMGESGTVRKTD